MRRCSAALAAALVLALLAACAPAASEFDPATGAGYDAVVAAFEAKSDAAQQAEVAARDASVTRFLWTGGLEDALGGADAADEVFTGLTAQLGAGVDGARADGASFQLASTRDSVAEAQGAGLFGGMMMSGLLSDAGLVATADGTTGEASHDFGTGGKATITSGEDGTVATRYEVSTTYKGVKITIVVGTEVNPCPDSTGKVDTSGLYQVNIEGPDGAGSSTQIDLDMHIQVDDDAKIASSDYDFESTYMTRPQAADQAIFDLTSKSMTFRKKGSDFSVTDLSAAGFWSDKFQKEAASLGIFLAAWVAHHLESAAQKAWQDGRCISLAAAYSDGPSGLDPDAEVTITATPTAKQDGQPAGGAVTAALSGGGKSVAPSGSKVAAPADFTYIAPGEKDKSGTVHLESRSKRGVGKLDVTLDTKRAAAYSIAGGAGDWSAEGTACDITKPYEISGLGLTMHLSPSGAGTSGSYTLDGFAGYASWQGEGTFTLTIADGGQGVLKTDGRNTVTGPPGVASADAAADFTLTPLEGTPAGC